MKKYFFILFFILIVVVLYLYKSPSKARNNSIKKTKKYETELEYVKKDNSIKNNKTQSHSQKKELLLERLKAIANKNKGIISYMLPEFGLDRTKEECRGYGKLRVLKNQKFVCTLDVEEQNDITRKVDQYYRDNKLNSYQSSINGSIEPLIIDVTSEEINLQIRFRGRAIVSLVLNKNFIAKQVDADIETFKRLLADRRKNNNDQMSARVKIMIHMISQINNLIQEQCLELRKSPCKMVKKLNSKEFIEIANSTFYWD